MTMTEGEKVVANGAGSGDAESNLNLSSTSEHDPQFEPIVHLPEVVVPTFEEEEDEMIKLRAKLYRFDSSETPSEWKDRGTGEVKLLKHKTRDTVRVVMRRDKTLKICANHFITPWMELTPNCGSDRAWVWSVEADYTHEVPQPELLAIRFASAEIAQRWKEKFDEAKKIVANNAMYIKTENSDDEENIDSIRNPASCDVGKSDEAVVKEEETTDVVEKLEKLEVSDNKCASPETEKEATDN